MWNRSLFMNEIVFVQNEIRAKFRFFFRSPTTLALLYVYKFRYRRGMWSIERKVVIRMMSLNYSELADRRRLVFAKIYVKRNVFSV